MKILYRYLTSEKYDIPIIEYLNEIKRSKSVNVKKNQLSIDDLNK